MKRSISLLLCAVLLLCLTGCGGCSRAPEVDEIYDRVVELVEDSRRLNAIFYGAGLPVYDKESVIYRDVYADDPSAYTKEYSIVDPRCGFVSVSALKEAAEKVWTPDLLEKQVYPAAFDGLSASIGSVSSIAAARFQEDGGNLYCLDGVRENAPAQLIFDYSTMKVVRPSNATRVILSMDAWEEGKPDARFSYRLTIAKVDGVWLLDKLTV